MTDAVGTFGGYKGRAVDWIPDRNGILTCFCTGRPSALALTWSFGSSGAFALGAAVDPAAPAQPAAVQSAVTGGVTLTWTEGDARALLSRAWPAVRLHLARNVVLWRTTGQALLGVVDGAPGQLALPGKGTSEPWLVVFGHAGAEDAAVLLTFTRPLVAIEKTADGYLLTFDAPAVLHAMPLEGIARHPPGDEAVDHWVVSARAWVAPLLAFPTGCAETADVTGERATITTAFTYEVVADAWGTAPEVLAPIPPAVALAAAEGFPVGLPEGLVTGDAQRCIPTFFGPFQFVRGDVVAYSLPVPPTHEALPPPRRAREAWAEPIRKEMLTIAAGIHEPSDDYVDNNLRRVAFLADAAPELSEAVRAQARKYAAAALAGALRPLYTTTEPITGQGWSTIAKTWRSHFSETDPPWAKDQERFDSEFYNGQALAGIAAAARLDPVLGRSFWEEAKALYRYDQIFWDWPLGSVLTHATGDSANIDGIQFAWEGMLAMITLAKQNGDHALAADATLRATRQQAALYALWCQAAWAQRCDYAIGHLSGGRLPAAEVETRGAVDAFVEEYGTATLELRSFWQCTGFLSYGNRPLFAFFQRHGLLERVRALEYEVMPALHPSWTDGNAVDPHAENGQERYGTSWTAAHLAARAALFQDDALALFSVYTKARTSPAEDTWYRMTLSPIAGPLLLALLEGGPPRVA